MGRYDGPHFEVEHEDVVSVWVATSPFDAIPEDYFLERYDEEDDQPFNRFSNDFGFGFYDHDFTEAHSSDDGQPIPIQGLIEPCSYGKSFAVLVAVAASSLGIKESSSVFLMFNFKYDSAVTGVRESPFFKFIGVFPFEQ